MDISKICEQYFNMHQNLDTWKTNSVSKNALITLTVASYFTIIIPFCFKIIQKIDFLVGKVKKEIHSQEQKKVVKGVKSIAGKTNMIDSSPDVQKKKSNAQDHDSILEGKNLKPVQTKDEVETDHRKSAIMEESEKLHSQLQKLFGKIINKDINKPDPNPNTLIYKQVLDNFFNCRRNSAPLFYNAGKALKHYSVNYKLDETIDIWQPGGMSSSSLPKTVKETFEFIIKSDGPFIYTINKLKENKDNELNQEMAIIGEKIINFIEKYNLHI